MKIFDCTLFYDEDMILELRLNILNKYVDKFVIAESKFTHSGERKKLNFNINKFPDFKKKIIYLPIEDEPDDLVYENNKGNHFERVEHSGYSVPECEGLRTNFMRFVCMIGIQIQFSDLILYKYRLLSF